MKRPILPYTLPIIVILIFLLGMSACDKLKVSPDIRKEQVTDPDIKPDYFGIRWDMKW